MTPTLRSFTIDGTHIEAFDNEGSNAAEIVAGELQQDRYRLRRIGFVSGDVVVDIGGHIGLFAIYLGLRFPNIVLHSFEPFPDNYELFRRNLALNPVRNIHLHTVAISADGRNLKMATNFFNTGGATCNSTSLYYRRVENIHSDTLDQVFDSLGIATCKLLKIDCEGSEYEILLSTGVLSRVEYLSAEFHTNRLLKSQGYSVKQLRRHCREYFDRKKLVFHSCKMSQ